MTAQAIPYITLVAFLFGTTLIASRFSVGQFAPLTYISLRLFLASLCHLTIYGLLRSRHLPRSRRLWRHAAVLGVFGTALPMSLIVSSLQFQSSGITAILLTTGPAITILMAHFLLPDESLTLRKGLGALIALSGALLLALLGETGLPDVQQANPLGYILVMSAMVFASATTIYARRYMRELDTFDVSSARMFIAVLVITPITFLFVGYDMSAVTSTGYMALIYASLIGTFAGTLMAFYNVQRFGATAAAVTGYLIPMIAAIGGLLLLDETITLGMLVGMGIILAGVALLNRKPGRVESEIRSLPP